MDVREHTVGGASDPILGLRDIYQRSEAAKVVLDHFSHRDRNWPKTTVKALQFALARDGRSLSQGTIVEVLAQLEQLGLGYLRRGQRGYEFAWNVELVAVGKAARGETAGIPTLRHRGEPPAEDRPSVDEEDDTFVDHRFLLRPGVEVNLRLPGDLTKREAERLADFIRTLPFE
jgi:hypothetical protein